MLKGFTNFVLSFNVIALHLQSFTSQKKFFVLIYFVSYWNDSCRFDVNHYFLNLSA